MALEELELIEVVQGSFSSLFVFINIFVGVIIISKYFKFNRIEFLLVGIAWIGLGMPWVPDTINFLLILTNNATLDSRIYLLIGNVFLPIFIILWLAALLPLLGVDTSRKNLAIIITVIISIIYEIAFFYFLATDPSQVGTELGPFHYEFGLFVEIFLLGCIALVLITGLRFASESLKSENPEIKLKGKLLIIAFLLFTIAGIFDSQGGLEPIAVALIRTVLIASAITFYMGFTLPEWTKKIFLK